MAKLLLEEASTQKSEFLENSDFSASIPILVELRYWQGSLSDLIHNAIACHDPTLKSVPLDRLLTNALLLFDGVNELPSNKERTELSAFRHNHPNLPMIFTTRDLSQGGDLGIERQLEMLPLTEPQMQAIHPCLHSRAGRGNAAATQGSVAGAWENTVAAVDAV